MSDINYGINVYTDITYRSVGHYAVQAWSEEIKHIKYYKDEILDHLEEVSK